MSETRVIPLTKGYFAIVDAEEYESLSRHKWTATERRKGSYMPVVHAYRQVVTDGKRSTIYMHRELLGVSRGSGIVVDHRNHNGLDNRKENLRCCDIKQNVRNASLSRANTSGYKGVSWCAAARKYAASIMVNYRHLHLGLFGTAKEAATAYDAAAVKHFGEFAATNN